MLQLLRILVSLLVLLVGLSVCSTVHGPCVTVDDCGENEYCHEDHCACKDEHQLFDGVCHPPKQHGDECSDQIQCSLSGDKYLQCLAG